MATKQEKRLLAGIILIGLVVRLIYSLSVDNILHPDEVVQYLEQAHRSAYGYGLIPWEYRHGVRSWLLPWLLAVPLKAVHALGQDKPEIYIPSIKAIMCLLSCSLIYTSYVIAESCWTKRAGFTAAAVTASWFELVIYSPRATPEVLATYSFCIAMAILISARQSLHYYWSGLAAALCLCLRYQYLGPLLVLIALLGPRPPTRSSMFFAAGFLTAVSVVATIDASYWGNPLLPYINNFRYNAILGISSTFGVKSHSFFFEYFAALVALLLLFSTIVRFGIISPLMRSMGIMNSERAHNHRGKQGIIVAVLAIILVTLATHTAVLHKEYRFVVLCIPLACILTAGITDLNIWKGQRTSTTLEKGLRIVPMFLCLVGLVLAVIASLPSLSELARFYRRLLRTSDSLEATKILNKDPDVNAILRLDTTRGFAGGFYYLHRPARIYGVADAKDLDLKDYRLHFSHIVQKESARKPPGFQVIHHVGNTLLILRRKQERGSEIDVLEGGREIINPRIDGIYKPAISRPN